MQSEAIKMKKLCILFLGLVIIILTAVAGATAEGVESGAGGGQAEYFRVHIRANSNDAEDQAVKYLVRDAIVEKITPWVAACTNKEEALAATRQHLDEIEETGESVLRENGFSYGVKADVRKEEFPTRVYEEYTLAAGVYDALIVELGTGEGDNWWCCIYPPLCFTSVSGANIIYRSKILETIDEFFGG